MNITFKKCLLNTLGEIFETFNTLASTLLLIIRVWVGDLPFNHIIRRAFGRKGTWKQLHDRILLKNMSETESRMWASDKQLPLYYFITRILPWLARALDDMCGKRTPSGWHSPVSKVKSGYRMPVVELSVSRVNSMKIVGLRTDIT